MGRAPGEAVLDIERLIKRYRGFKLGPVSATLSPGVTALLGENGAGKSTMMRLIVGTTRPSGGRVTLPPQESGNARIGFLPQDFTALKTTRVADYLAFVAWCRSTSRFKIERSAISDALLRVGLEDKAATRIGTLSGGMVRRLGVAQALLGARDVLVLDEPTVGLDPVQRKDMRVLINELGKSRIVLVSTHLAEDVVAIASHVLVLDQGSLVYDGDVATLCGGGKPTAAKLEAGFLTRVARAEELSNAR